MHTSEHKMASNYAQIMLTWREIVKGMPWLWVKVRKQSRISALGSNQPLTPKLWKIHQAMSF